MIDFDLFNPTELTGFVRALQFNEYALEQWLPHVDVGDIEVAFTTADKRREEMASYRGFDVPAPIGDRPGVSRKSAQIPPMSKKLLLTEWERLNLAKANGQTNADDLLRQLAYDDASLLTESLIARLEYARGTVVQDATVTFVTDTGYTGVVQDWGTVVSATVSNLWSDFTNADPVGDLITAHNAYILRNRGRRAAAVLTSTADIANAVRCAKFRTYAGVGASIPTILTPAQANTILASFEVPPLVPYDTQVNVPGSGDTRVLPAGHAFLMPERGDSARFGMTAYGVTAEALELVGKGFLTMPTAPGLVCVGMTEFDPVTKWTKVSGIAIPVLKDPSLITNLTIA